jgi:hypothetical protein
MSDFFFLCESENASKDSIRYYVRVSERNQQGDPRLPLSAKALGGELFSQAVQNGSIHVEGEYKITEIETETIPSNLSVVANFEPVGSVSVIP